jgi:OmpA-OmpF porin, OOP family
VQALEANKAAKSGLETPLVARSTRVRDDLWAQIAQFKSNEATLACNARSVACAEVRLVRAGHAEEQTGWRAASLHVQIAEDGIRRAKQEAANCSAPVVAGAAAGTSMAAKGTTPGATTAPAGSVTPVVQTITKETFAVLADALFKFDKSGRADMLPGGIERLNAVAQRLKSYQSIATLRIVGHTDRIGTDAYNETLSTRRAVTVQGYLETLGVKVAKAEAFGKGKREPITTNCSAKASLAEQIDCLQPDRRVTIEVTGVSR